MITANTNRAEKEKRHSIIVVFKLSMSLLMDFDIDVNFPNDSPVGDELA